MPCDILRLSVVDHYAICPKSAISMVEDEEGFEYPLIQEDKCIRCYQCLKVCPIKEAKKS